MVLVASSPTKQKSKIPDRPPLLWKLITNVVEDLVDPLDRGLPIDVCQTLCSFGEPVKRGLTAAACGGALLTLTLPNLICPVSINI